MKVKAIANINSGQYNVGDEFELAESEALALIEAGAVLSLEADALKAEETNTVTEQPTVTPPVEAPATEVPLVPAPDQTGTLDAQPMPEQPSPVLKNEGKQPTEAEIARTVALAEKSSTDLPNVQIS